MLRLSSAVLFTSFFLLTDAAPSDARRGLIVPLASRGYNRRTGGVANVAALKANSKKTVAYVVS